MDLSSKTRALKTRALETRASKTREELKEVFRQCRSHSVLLAEPLSAEDKTIQTMPDVSPTKWHLAHTSWFFETFLLQKFSPSYEPLNPNYSYLFNSYYEQIGDKWLRAERGLLSRPSVAEVMDYRTFINEKMNKLIDSASEKLWQEIAPLVALGIHHEWQHQELLLTDIKHVLAYNPRRPAAYPKAQSKNASTSTALNFLSFEGGVHHIGQDENNNTFCFDNEAPCHQRFLQNFSLGERLITNGEYLEFIEDGGYKDVALWLSDGWAEKQKNNWDSPLYWRKDENEGWVEYSLAGEAPIDKNCPVIHISFYEAAAFARWANKRLPREEEIEVASAALPIQGNLGKMIEKDKAVAVGAEAASGLGGLEQIYGDGWEWTQSPYTPYPKYKAAKSALGEYNGKFMCNQLVLKGGSCATPLGQVRQTYRNFFHPNARWQFSAIRLADDE